MRPRTSSAAVAVVAGMLVVSDPTSFAQNAEDNTKSRKALIARAKVWHQTDVASMNLRTGPEGPGSFAPGETITCDYTNKDLTGASPKFACKLPSGDAVKVKYSGAAMFNGEVYGEVAASRLLWALGFAADRMYPVRVICHGCPDEFGGTRRDNGDRIIDPAVVERKIGRELADTWEWNELEQTDESQGGATKAERDALKLLAALLQHSDSKAINQRIVCLDDSPDAKAPCAEPVMMINDLGITFGRALARNQQPRASVNLKEWAQLPIWKDRQKCVANLSGSHTGTLKDPAISEAGRQFLADLLSQLSDQQLRDLFDVARVTLRQRDPTTARSGFPTVDEWVTAFKQKRAQIVEHRCAA